MLPGSLSAGSRVSGRDWEVRAECSEWSAVYVCVCIYLIAFLTSLCFGVYCSGLRGGGCRITCARPVDMTGVALGVLSCCCCCYYCSTKCCCSLGGHVDEGWRYQMPNSLCHRFVKLGSCAMLPVHHRYHQHTRRTRHMGLLSTSTSHCMFM